VILVDTSIWSLALRRRRGDLGVADQRHVHEWERLVRLGVVAMIGPIRQELLSGIRDQRMRERLRRALRPFPDLALDVEDYEHAAGCFNRCRAQGIAGSAVDFMICAASMRYAAPIYTADRDFERYAGVLELTLHQVNPQA